MTDTDKLPPPEYGATDAEAGNPLPTYDETANQAPPPSYESLYGRIKEARQSTDNNATFFKKMCSIIGNTIGFIIIVAVFLAIPVAMIAVGAMNLDNCPIQRLIPIWLVVAGASAAVMQLGNLYDRIKAKCSGKTQEEIEEESSSLWRSFNGCLGCFNFAWFIAGNVWVYKIYKPSFNVDTDPEHYCDNVTYMFAFWLITATYIMMGLICFCSCCIAMCVSKSK